MQELAIQPPIPYVDAPLPDKTSWWGNIEDMIAEGFSRAARLATRDLHILPEDQIVRSLQPYVRDRQRIAHEAIRAERAGGSPDIRNIAYHVQAGGFAEDVQQEILRHQIGKLWIEEDGFTGSKEVRELCNLFGIDHKTRKPFSQPPSSELPASQQLFNAALTREAALSYTKTQIELIDEGKALRAAQPRGRERLRRWIETKKEERPWHKAPHALDYFTQGMSPFS